MAVSWSPKARQALFQPTYDLSPQRHHLDVKPALGLHLCLAQGFIALMSSKVGVLFFRENPEISGDICGYSSLSIVRGSCYGLQVGPVQDVAN